jgi:hypothetical protein
VAPPVFKTGLAGIAFAGRFDSFPPPPQYPSSAFCSVQFQTLEWRPSCGGPSGFSSVWRSQSLRHPALKSDQPTVKRPRYRLARLAQCVRDADTRWYATHIKCAPAAHAHATRHAKGCGASYPARVQDGNPRMNDTTELLRDQLRNAVVRWSAEDQVSWAIFSLFITANAIIARQLPHRDDHWFSASFACSGGLAASIVWRVLQRRVIWHLDFFEDVVCELEKELALSAHFVLSSRRNLVKEKLCIRGLARSVMLLSIDGATVVWGAALWYFARPDCCSLSCRTILATLGILGCVSGLLLVVCDLCKLIQRACKE